MLTRMEADPTQRGCVAKIHSALDVLEADPGDAHNRRRRFQNLDLWGVAVACADDEWLILWEELATGAVVVHHIVPAP